MAKKKGLGRIHIIVECTEARKMGRPDLVSQYHTEKNKKNNPERMEIMKYNPNLRKHTLHKEVK